jgi:hypothetical protein
MTTVSDRSNPVAGLWMHLLTAARGQGSAMAESRSKRDPSFRRDEMPARAESGKRDDFLREGTEPVKPTSQGGRKPVQDVVALDWTTARRPKPHPLRNVPRNKAKRMIERGVIPSCKGSHQWCIDHAASCS